VNCERITLNEICTRKFTEGRVFSMKIFAMRVLLATGSGLLLMQSFAACARPNYASAVHEATVQKVSSGSQCLQVNSTQFLKSLNCVSYEWEKRPTEEETGSFLLRLNPAPGAETGGAPVDFVVPPEVVLWMPSMGHGSSPVTVSRVAVGVYRVSQVFFVMPGDWQIKIKLKSGNVILDEATFVVKI
jgi:hypothetical protein